MQSLARFSLFIPTVLKNTFSYTQTIWLARASRNFAFLVSLALLREQTLLHLPQAAVAFVPLAVTACLRQPVNHIGLLVQFNYVDKKPCTL